MRGAVQPINNYNHVPRAVVGQKARFQNQPRHTQGREGVEEKKSLNINGVGINKWPPHSPNQGIVSSIGSLTAKSESLAATQCKGDSI